MGFPAINQQATPSIPKIFSKIFRVPSWPSVQMKMEPVISREVPGRPI